MLSHPARRNEETIPRKILSLLLSYLSDRALQGVNLFRDHEGSVDTPQTDVSIVDAVLLAQDTVNYEFTEKPFLIRHNCIGPLP